MWPARGKRYYLVPGEGECPETEADEADAGSSFVDRKPSMPEVLVISSAISCCRTLICWCLDAVQLARAASEERRRNDGQRYAAAGGGG